ncbi:hypothetical protein Hdeb2414_s0069g00770601 [Helianthus debilis subsp. tardiflorus]
MCALRDSRHRRSDPSVRRLQLRHPLSGGLFVIGTSHLSFSSYILSPVTVTLARSGTLLTILQSMET